MRLKTNTIMFFAFCFFFLETAFCAAGTINLRDENVSLGYPFQLDCSGDGIICTKSGGRGIITVNGTVSSSSVMLKTTYDVDNDEVVDIANTANMLANGDYGDFSSSAGVIFIVTGAVEPCMLETNDFGDIAITDCVMDIEPNVIGGTELDEVLNFSPAGTWNYTNGTLILPTGTSLPSNECDESDEAGAVLVKTDATSGKQLYVCEGTGGWVLSGDGNDGGGGTGATEDFGGNTGPISTTDNFTIGTTLNTIGGKLTIDGDVDQVQIQVQGHTTQTSNLIVAETSDGTDVMTVSNLGVLTLAGTVIAPSFEALPSATPTTSYVDSDTTDQDDSTRIVTNCTDTGSGTEDCDMTFSQQIAGAMTAFLTSDADGVVTIARDLEVSDEVYGAGWNGSTEVPTKNAVYDKVETLGGGGGDSIFVDTAALTDAYFVSTGDIDFVNTSNTITANINSASVDVSMLSNGTDGELITWNSSGVAATVSVGTSGQILTSNGSGAAPTFQDNSGIQITLMQWNANQGYPCSATNYATLDTRNYHPVLDFDGSTNESICFDFVLPDDYIAAPGGGLNVSLYTTSSGTSGDMDWDVAFEDTSAQDIDSDGFAAVNSTDGTSVNATSGVQTEVVIAFSDGADMDSCSAGDPCRIKVTRDAASDTSTDDNQLLRVVVYQ